MIKIRRKKELLDEILRLDEIMINSIRCQSVYDMLENTNCEDRTTEDNAVELLKMFDSKLGNTLAYDSKEYLNNPYNKNISFENIKSKDIEYKLIDVPSKLLTFMEWRDGRGFPLFEGVPRIGYYTEDIKVPVLQENGNVWMSPTIAEIRSMKAHIEKAHGDICTIGLGIGYYVYMTGLKEDVNSITVIEYNKDIINIFKEYILVQFPEHIRSKINIIHGDMFDYYNEEFLSKFNCTFIDTWQNNEDGLENYYIPLMEKMLPFENIGFWIEQDIIQPVQHYLLIYIKTYMNLIDSTYSEFLQSFNDDSSQAIIKKIHKYFNDNDYTINTKELLRNHFYDISVIREILATKID